MRTERHMMTIGEATIDLRQLQKALDQNASILAQTTVNAWVDKAWAHQQEKTSDGHISGVLPHLRPPPDHASLPWFSSIADDRLLCCLISDEQDSVRYLDPIEITNHGLGASGLLDRAKINLSLLPPYSLSDCVPHPDFDDIWLIETRDGHDAARLLTAHTLTDRALIAWVPHRDRLVVTTRSVDELGPLSAKLRSDAILCATVATHPISAEAFLLSRGSISHLRFQADHRHGTLLLPEY